MPPWPAVPGAHLRLGPRPFLGEKDVCLHTAPGPAESGCPDLLASGTHRITWKRVSPAGRKEPLAPQDVTQRPPLTHLHLRANQSFIEAARSYRCACNSPLCSLSSPRPPSTWHSRVKSHWQLVPSFLRGHSFPNPAPPELSGHSALPLSSRRLTWGEPRRVNVAWSAPLSGLLGDNHAPDWCFV